MFRSLNQQRRLLATHKARLETITNFRNLRESPRAEVLAALLLPARAFSPPASSLVTPQFGHE